MCLATRNQVQAHCSDRCLFPLTHHEWGQNSLGQDDTQAWARSCSFSQQNERLLATPLSSSQQKPGRTESMWKSTRQKHIVRGGINSRW